jgi:hypothetical protein
VIELEVQNFQSIRSATMAVSGFAAIVGKSNIGKSALVRAAQYALTGAAGTNFVRHGPECDRRVKSNKKCKCFSKVVVRTSKMQVTWEKGDNVNRYTVLRVGSDVPEVYDGLERGTPEFFLPDFQLVKVGDSKELIQIPDQFEPIFLLNKSGPAVADVLSDVARLDRINLAMSQVAKDRKDTVAKRKIREEDVAKLKVSRAAYDGLDDIKVDPLLKGLEEIRQKRELLKRMDQFSARARALKGELVALMEAAKVEVPVFDTLESAADSLVNVSRLNSEFAPLNEETVQLEEALVPALPDGDGLEKTSGALDQISRFLDELTEKAPALRKLMGVDKIEIPGDGDLQRTYEDLSKIESLLVRSEVAEKQVSLWQKIEEVTIPDVDFLQANVGQLGQVTDLVGRGKTLVEVVTKLGQDLKDVTSVEAEVVKEMEAIGVCPTCDQPLGPHQHLHLEESAQ